MKRTDLGLLALVIFHVRTVFSGQQGFNVCHRNWEKNNRKKPQEKCTLSFLLFFFHSFTEKELNMGVSRIQVIQNVQQNKRNKFSF